MRGRDAIAVALRHPDGRIVCATERLDSGFHGSRWSKLPFVRGLVVLYETLVVGTRWLVRSATSRPSDEGVELGKGTVALMLGITLAAGDRDLLPAAAVHRHASRPATSRTGSSSTSSRGSSGSRSSSATWSLIGRAPDIRRVFQYHGAEHMTIHALEAGDPLDRRRRPQVPDRPPALRHGVPGRRHPALDPRVQPRRPADAAGDDRQPDPAHPGHRRGRLRAPPVRRAAPRQPDRPGDHVPGILVQKITTKQPTDDMIEVAIVSMEQALVADGEHVPDGRRGPRARARSTPDPAARCARAADGRRPPHRRSTPPTRRPMTAPASTPSSHEVARQYDDIQAELVTPGASTDPDAIRRLGRELARLEPVVEAFRELEDDPRRARRRARDARRRDRRRDARDGARGDRPPRGRRGRASLDELKVSLLPRDPNDDRNVIVEIRAGAGGEEAALFAAELLRMYLPLRRASTAASAEVTEPQRDRHRRHQGGDRRGRRRRRLLAASSSRAASTASSASRRPSRPAGSTPRPRPSSSCPRPTRSRSRSTRSGPPDRRQALVGPGRPVGQHDRLGGPHHPPADGPRRRDPGREEPAQEQGQGDGRAARPALRPRAPEAARGAIRRPGGR